MCGKMCGKIEICVKYVRNALRTRNSVNSIKISASALDVDQRVSYVKLEAQDECLKTSGLGLNRTQDGIPTLVVELPPKKLEQLVSIVVSVISSSRPALAYIDSTIGGITQLLTWHLHTNHAMQNMAGMPKPRTQEKGLGLLVSNSARRIATFVV